ncbi:hypothetical protein DXA95_16240 [Odoribacter sp. OF09-27XD]|nr:hypothetical protein DXA95_16240 [Odoribacter sp. OF09-27XD]
MGVLIILEKYLPPFSFAVSKKSAAVLHCSGDTIIFSDKVSRSSRPPQIDAFLNFVAANVQADLFKNDIRFMTMYV